MSSIEAMVHLELEARKIPFSWRFFDGNAPNLQLMMPEFNPEFTLREYNVVILILGNFYGTLPGVLDKNALAQVLLEEDGWKVIQLWEDDIRRGAANALDRLAPELRTLAFEGPPRPNPYGRPDFMEKRRASLSGAARYAITRLRLFTPTGGSRNGAVTGRRKLRVRALAGRRRARGTAGRQRNQTGG